ncbi:hypothetical protein GS399_13415 [Pedobacter sp. HMF7647]|uniref:Type I restriction modification DNA specificity domain-containing protein n=1 Tax=Hufsiella arboris TaxID=2695275 RepID=A0A7K1YBM7_9SPHI|nr:restriction endonuclease subunit S [Hufsiella arboris]MXV51975.1 hypothetical protein [Hufsiella arboris]
MEKVELYNIPSNWVWANITDIAYILDHLREPVNSKERQRRIDGKEEHKLFPYYGATGQVGYIDDYLTDDDYILIGEDGAPFFDPFKSKAYPISGKSWVNNHAHIIKAHEFFSQKFLLNYLNQFDYKKYVNGTTRLKLTKGSLETFPVPVPPIKEQERITEKIDELFSELDKSVDSFKLIQAQLSIYRQVVLKLAFEGHFSSSWRIANNPEPGINIIERLIVKNEEDYKLQMVIWLEQVERWKIEKKITTKPVKPKTPKVVANLSQAQVDVLPSIPKEWSWTKLSAFTEITSGVTKGKKYNNIETFEVPYLGVANVQDGYLNLIGLRNISVSHFELEKYKLKYGDILYTEGGDKDKLGRGTIWKNEVSPCIHQNHIFRARIETDEINPIFCALYSGTRIAKDYFFSKAKQTTNLASINLSVLSDLPFPIMSKVEQDMIVNYIETQNSMIDYLENSIQKALAELNTLRQSVLKFAFNGKLVLAIPEEESGKLLLERINLDKINYQVKPAKRRIINQQKKQMSAKNLTIIDVLKASPGPISAKSVWEQSKYSEDIEAFYSELKKVQSQVVEVEKGMLSLIDENR